MGNTVGIILLSYDIDKLHTKVKDALIGLGYLEKFKNHNDPKIYILPNTTLWHESKSSNDAINDLKEICNDLSVKIEKAVSVKANEFVGV